MINTKPQMFPIWLFKKSRFQKATGMGEETIGEAGRGEKFTFERLHSLHCNPMRLA